MQKEDFLQSIQANPGNTRLRLMYADWLEERGDPLAQEWRQPVRHVSVATEYFGTGYGDGSDGRFGDGDGDGACSRDDWGCGRSGRSDGDGVSADDTLSNWHGSGFQHLYEFQSLNPWLSEDDWLDAVEAVPPSDEADDDDAVFNYYEVRRRHDTINTPPDEAFPWYLLPLGGLGWLVAGTSAYMYGPGGVSPISLILALSSLLSLVLFAWFTVSKLNFKSSPQRILLLTLGGLVTSVAVLLALYFALTSR